MHGREVLRAAGDLLDGRVALGYFMTRAARRDTTGLNNNRIPAGRPLRRSSFSRLLDLLAPGLVGVLALRLCGTDTVAKLSPFTHETRRLSCDHEEGLEASHRRHRRELEVQKITEKDAESARCSPQLPSAFFGDPARPLPPGSRAGAPTSS